MKPIRLFSAAEQVAGYLREEIASGALGGEMPGIHHLAAELVANHKTVEAALGILEKEGFLERQGAGRRRRILTPRGKKKKKALRIAILNYEPPESVERFVIELQHALQDAGHDAFFPGKSLTQLSMDKRQVAEHVGETEADAWVVTAGSLEVLSWFMESGVPAMALFGRRRSLAMAGVGPDKAAAYSVMTRRLLELGHRRIVLLARRARRLPEPGLPERMFLQELEAQGVATGNYHLPVWEETAEGFHECLENLFQITPPTALIIDEAQFYFAALQFLAFRGLRVPDDVSLVCTDGDPAFAWFRPTVSHITWDSGRVVRRIVRWAGNVARGKEDQKQTLTKAEFIEGGSVGLAAR